ncbi:MAG TPA: hypothetical protein VFE98_04020 [Candidatus Bathyarchaeia archaeon]|nr:hypothetical protein [Candidatus Bathyarchaeia archaeon]
MDVVREIERRSELPRTVLAFLAIILGIVIILEPRLLALLVGLFLIILGVYEAYKMATNKTTSTVASPVS